MPLRILESRNRNPGHCERCGARLAVGEGNLEYCVEDSGCPLHHDQGGYHLRCANGPECELRVADARKIADEAEAEAERKAAEQQEQETAWTMLVLRLTAGLEPTGYGPPLYIGTVRAGELVASAPEGIRSAADEVRRVDGDLVTVVYHSWIVRRYVAPERARVLRLLSAREMGVTVEDAIAALDKGYVGEDQRAMYQAVLASAGLR